MSGEHKARALLIDTDFEAMDKIRIGQSSHIFDHEYLCNTLEGSGGISVRARETIIKPLVHVLKDRIRLMLESCDSLDGIIIYFSPCGGTGSGITDYIQRYVLFD